MPINKTKFKKGDKVKVFQIKRVANYPIGTEFIVEKTESSTSGNCVFPKHGNGMYEEDLKLIYKNMNNLAKAKKALIGERFFRIVFKQEETFEITVKAKNKEEAEKIATEEHNNGNTESNEDCDVTVESIEETEEEN